MKTEHITTEKMQVRDDQINWVISHPDMSDWLKQALRTARDRSPVDILNDLEILNAILRPRSQVMIDRLMPASESRHPGS